MEQLGVCCHWQWTARDAATNKIIWQTPWVKNKVVQLGINFIAELLANLQTNNVPKYLVMGTGTTPVSMSDEKLETEGYRKIVTAQTTQSGMARIRFFIPADEANGDWAEWGMMVKGTAQAESGELYNRVLPPGGISKTDNATLTVELKNTFVSG